jgi:hypothetical protein
MNAHGLSCFIAWRGHGVGVDGGHFLATKIVDRKRIGKAVPLRANKCPWAKLWGFLSVLLSVDRSTVVNQSMEI